MVGNSILDQVIEQARQRNAQTAAAQQARMAAMPQSVAPIVNPILENLDGGGMESMAPNVIQSPQQAYNSALAFSQSPISAVVPLGGVIADVTRNNMVGAQGVRQLSAQPYGVFGRAMGWSDAPADNTPYQSSAWNALRDTFKPSPMAPDAATEDNFSAESAEDAAANSGWGASAANFGASYDDGGFDATYGGTYGGDDGGGFDDGGSWGGAGASAIGGDFGMDSDTSVA